MNDSTDNTNELDSYGVWVKHQPGTDADTAQSEEVASADNLNIDDAFDLPDFPETEDTGTDGLDFDSVFSDSNDTIDAINPEFEIPVEDTLDLSDNKTDEAEETFEIPTEDVFGSPTDDLSEDFSDISNKTDNEETEDDPFSLPDMPSEETFNFPEEEPLITEETSVEEPVFEESVTEETSEEISDEPVIEESVTEETTDIDISSFETSSEDGEISLDEFGFDDSSTSSDSFELPTEDGEISLDDFGFDDSSSEKAEEIVDEKALDMDISFDPSADEVVTEENIQTETSELTEEQAYKAAEVQSEEVDLSAFETHSTDISAGATEEIDLSDFGIDADAEETPITQNVEESKLKDKVVDYDLSVSDDNMASAPVVNEIKETEKSEEDNSPAPSNAVVAVADEGLLQQIVADLSDLKNEINNLKVNLEEMKSAESHTAASEPDIPATNDDDFGGFFDDTDGDDTIALSGNELDNIMNNVEFSEVSVENTLDDEPVFEETAVTDEDLKIPETQEDTGGFFDDIDGDDTIALSGNELDNIMSNVDFGDSNEVNPEADKETSASDETEFSEEDIPAEIDIEPVSTDEISDDFSDDDDVTEEKEVSDSESSFVNDDIFGSVDESEEDFITDESDVFGYESEVQTENEEALKEPDLDDIVIENNIEEELPDEISIPKGEDIDSILVESSNDDFMNSVNDSTPEENVMEEETKIDDFDSFMDIEAPISDSLTDDNLNYLNEDVPLEDNIIPEEAAVDSDSENISDEVSETSMEQEITSDEIESDETEETENETFPTVDSITENEVDTIEESEPTFEETAVTEDEVFDDSVEETQQVEIPVEKTNETVESADNNDNDNLKQDIKSVLLYMDQLLENLPEEKIVEFAKSDEFSTYKKLFSELGLS